jgi:hypothetical protein
MDEKLSYQMKNGQIGWKFGDKKMSFWKKIAKISIFEFFFTIWRYFASKKNTTA